MSACLALLVQLHGDGDRIDLIYFLSSLLIVALPLAVFTTLAYLLIKGYWKSGERRP